MSPVFPEVPLRTYYPCAIHPFSTDYGKPHITLWGWEVGPRSPIYSETDLPQGQVLGYPPHFDVPASHSSPGKLGLDVTILVASANIIELANLLIVHGISFMYIRNINGPGTETHGTPCLTSSHGENILLDLLSLITVDWYLLSKYVFISLWTLPKIP